MRTATVLEDSAFIGDVNMHSDVTVGLSSSNTLDINSVTNFIGTAAAWGSLLLNGADNETQLNATYNILVK